MAAPRRPRSAARPANAPKPPRTVRKAAADAPGNRLVVYVHGIGNKPVESVLENQWDQALFGVNMGDRTRMAYWVNRSRYPIPEAAQGSGADRVDPQAVEVRSLALRPALGLDPGDFEDEIAAIVGVEAGAGGAGARATGRAGGDAAAALRSIAKQMTAAARRAADASPPPDREETSALRSGEVREKVLPLPEAGRRLISRWLTAAFLKDVHDFLFVDAERERMIRTLEARLTPGAGPFVVVAHSQGTMIAYATLCLLAERRPDLDIEVPLLVTIGSPLGMQEVVDRIRVITTQPKGKLRRPPMVQKWVNLGDTLDVVAVGNPLHQDYDLPSDKGIDRYGLGLNPQWRHDAHSATGYLSTGFVRDHVWNTLGPGFAQHVRPFVVARDVHAEIADAPEDRHHVLIELRSKSYAAASVAPEDRDTSATTRLDTTRAALETRIPGIAAEVAREEGRAAPDAAALEIEPLLRFLAARLTRSEIERLQAEYKELQIEKVWRNGIKRALIIQSVNTIQAATAHMGYGAMGRDIEWAVLDTGVEPSHPHFQKHRNIAAQWNCTARGDLETHPPGVRHARDGDGHGTHVCGIIAGRFERPLYSREWPGLPPVTFSGMAPEARLHVYKVLDDTGQGRDAWIIKALDHIARVNERHGRLKIHGLNLSLGSSYDPEVFGCGHTPLCEELRRLWRQGVLVCVSAGNEGYAVLRSLDGDVEANLDLSIGDPANLDDCIAVGSVHKTNPHTYGVSYFSSRGPTADGRQKPDLVAPGERVLSALNSYEAMLRARKRRKPAAGRAGEAAKEVAARDCYEDYYVEMGGTSMACPHVSGLLAAFLSARREFIGYPERVKQILLEHCTSLERDPYTQGRGLPNLTKMLLNT